MKPKLPETLDEIISAGVCTRISESVTEFVSQQTDQHLSFSNFVRLHCEANGISTANFDSEWLESQMTVAQQTGEEVVQITLSRTGDAITLNVGDIDIDRYADELQDAVNKSLVSYLDSTSADLYAATVRSSTAWVGDRAAKTLSFQAALSEKWGLALNSLSFLIHVCSSIGEAWNAHLRKTHRNGPLHHKVDAITRLNARSLQVAGEIETLLTAGYADGAISRWRTLHELIVTGLFIEKNEASFAERYLDHIHIEAYKIAKSYKEHQERLGYPGLPDEDWTVVSKKRDELLEKYGRPFADEHGWAKKKYFSEIEDAVELSRYRFFFKTANSNIHAGVHGATVRVGMRNGAGSYLLSGPSEWGLEEAGGKTADSLVKAMIPILALNPDADTGAWMSVLQKLSSQVEMHFVIAARLFRQQSEPPEDQG